MRPLIKALFLPVLLFVAQALYGQEQRLLNTPYTNGVFSGTVKAVLDDVLEKTGVSISYSSSVIDEQKSVHLSGKEKTIQDVLEVILAGEKVSFKERRNKILVVPAEDSKGTIARVTQVTVNGYVKDEMSKEVLIGAVVFVPGTNIATTTNNYGYYSMVLSAGKQTLCCAYVGYTTDTMTRELAASGRNDILLKAYGHLPEVNVTSDKDTKKGFDQLVYSDLTKRPALLGENDLMRALQGVAGVTGGVDGFNTVIVRGGEPGQNLNLLDDVPLYYVDHFFGLTSIYNSEAIKSVDFYKGAFPARFGGRTSSVIDVSTNDGDMQRWGGQFNIGLIKGGLNVEGPIIKNRSSIMVSARRTWIDALWRPVTNALGVDFYDVNTKANYIVNKNNRLYLSVYNGRDKIKLNINDDENVSAKWGNTMAAAKWNTIINPKLFLNTAVTYSSFRYELNDHNQVIGLGGITNTGNYRGVSSINETSVRVLANWYPDNHHHLQLGGHYSNASFVPVAVAGNQSVLGPVLAPIDRFNSNEVVVFAENEIKMGDRWMMKPGIHFANWFSSRYNYSSMQPRFYLEYTLTPKSAVYASFTDMAQFLHLISNNSYGLPTDFWLPSSTNIEPEEALLGTLGFKSKGGDSRFYSLELYYKDIQNVTTYSVGKNVFENTSRKWDDKIIQGTGWSYGMEVTAKKKLGHFNLLAAYTLSQSWRKFAELNQGRAFPYRFDRRHNLKAAFIYQRSSRFDATASWTYMSGEAVTLPDQAYADFDANLGIEPGSDVNSANYTYNYTDWNNYRLPPIHRLDIGLNFNKYKGKHYQRTWSLGVFNAYARKNVMYVELTQPSVDEGFQLKGYSFLRFVPYLTYKMSF